MHHDGQPLGIVEAQRTLQDELLAMEQWIFKVPCVSTACPCRWCWCTVLQRPSMLPWMASMCSAEP